MRTQRFSSSRRLAAMCLALVAAGCGRGGQSGDGLRDSAVAPSPDSAAAPPSDKMSTPAPTTSPQGRDLEGSPWRLVSSAQHPA